ncbi:MAG: hypothetical protein NC097_06140 [Clostridium sp.]|nr:hypothetical protein [Prevotella sp.]MCM1429359.1 hypothetical protein [Clostridium sp.]MCM1475606.1 hypothetical protein [Muribaculaceae bacterium]
MKGTTILSDFLKVLGVPFTGDYSDARFRSMPFQSLFGFSRLLKEYGIESVGISLSDKTQITKIPTPLIAQNGSGFIIITGFRNLETPQATVDYVYYHDKMSLSLDDFLKKFTGVVLLAYPSAESSEPDYAKHHFFVVAKKIKLILLIALVAFLVGLGYWQSGIYQHLSLILLSLTDFAGLGVCWLLILKTLRVKSHTADKFCGILQKHGCDTVLEQKSSTFFGLFSWSEVGLAYFSVSGILLFVFPQNVGWLALINGLCLPFTIWSITYQKFVIKAWCALCVTVQSLLWLQFFCYLFGGWWHEAFPLRLPIFEMGAAYVVVMLSLNRLMTWVNKTSPYSGDIK